ncbi:methyltransferase [Lentzea sp. E54]|uniref:methyltransferase n=1 Tax=Lentzea xerophila TaxID=3435883 RepID=UPI003DA6AE09
MLDRHDEQRLRAAMDIAARATAEDFLAGAVGGEFPESARMSFDHAGVLVFPDSVDDVVGFCVNEGYEVDEPFPSVVVRDRLARRYRVSARDLNVSIVRAHRRHGGQAGLEIFVLPQENASVHSGLVARERSTGAESHLAWFVPGDELEAVWRRCRQLDMRTDGCGYNPNEHAATGGRTVLYFQAGSAASHLGRLELTTSGHRTDVLDAHRSAEAENLDEHTALLSILAGHWAARAVHVAAQIGLADVLDSSRLSAADVAERTGCDPAAITRLLRYLERVGVVRQLDDATYANTEMGNLLHSSNPFSDLTRLYGGGFYDAWSELGATVRTGATAFRHRFGVEHFEHFAGNPEEARTFDRAMQAVAELVADEMARTYDFPIGATVIDVGGGNGTLLQAVLREHDEVSGVVFDRDHVTTHAASLHHGEKRFRTVSGDFFTSVPSGGDVYVLSRVLHDWSDEDCARILANCRDACQDGATLLVLERFLPEAGTPPRAGDLGAVWDLQMLAVTGGRERERSEYEKLLLDAGFQVQEMRALPVDLNLVVAKAC